MHGRQERSLIPIPSSQRPVLVVVVDTEEEFDWNATFSRSATSVSALREIHRFQEVCDPFGIRPTYVVTYPVATQHEGVEPLKRFHSEGRAEIGVHLHPWVSPPFVETLCSHNSYPGNLDPELESEKLRVLTEAVARAFGTRPAVYKAGRYGIGPNSATALIKYGYTIDASPAPPMDFRADGGPDFSSHPVEPYWFGEAGRLLGLPSTGAYVGFAGSAAHRLYSWSTRGALGRCRLPAVLARLGAVDRLRLSPEGFTLDETIKLTRWLFRRGLRVFQFTLHSPSLMPKGTPYVSSVADRERLLDLCRSYFEWFLGGFGGSTMMPTQLRDHILKTQSHVIAQER